MKQQWLLVSTKVLFLLSINKPQIISSSYSSTMPMSTSPQAKAKVGREKYLTKLSRLRCKGRRSRICPYSALTIGWLEAWDLRWSVMDICYQTPGLWIYCGSGSRDCPSIKSWSWHPHREKIQRLYRDAGQRDLEKLRVLYVSCSDNCPLDEDDRESQPMPGSQLESSS